MTAEKMYKLPERRGGGGGGGNLGNARKKTFFFMEVFPIRELKVELAKKGLWKLSF